MTSYPQHGGALRRPAPFLPRTTHPRLLPLNLLLGLALLSGCGHGAAPPKGNLATAVATMTVTTQKVVRRPVQDQLVVTGTVEAWQTLTISPETSGLKIQSLTAKIGDRVLQGAPLVYLNDSELRAELEAARARYRSSTASLEKSKQPNRPQEIASKKAAVDQARAVVAQEEANLHQSKVNRANAERNAKRYTDALREGYVTALETDERVTDREAQQAAVRTAQEKLSAAKFSLTQAQEELKLAQAGGRSEDIEIAAADRDLELASIHQLEAQLARTVINAPDSGLILTQTGYIGDVAATGTAIFTVARQGRLQLWATVPQQRLGSVDVGQDVVFEDGEKASVSEIDPTIDPATRQGRLRIELSEETKQKVGAFLRGTIAFPPGETLVVPADSVMGQSGAEHVFVLQGQQVKSVTVRLGQRHGDLVEIVEGLSADQHVVVTGAPFLNDGDTVRVSKS